MCSADGWGVYVGLRCKIVTTQKTQQSQESGCTGEATYHGMMSLASAIGLTGTASAHLLHPSAPLLGRDKWLGGALGADGNVYGVPGHAPQVLRIEPNNRDASGHARVTTIGGPFRGKYKWLRGVPAQDGAIYGIPSHAETVLKIDCTCAPPQISELGGPLPGAWKWHGGVLSPIDNCIYCIPQVRSHRTCPSAHRPISPICLNSPISHINSPISTLPYPICLNSPMDAPLAGSRRGFFSSPTACSRSARRRSK